MLRAFSIATAPTCAGSEVTLWPTLQLMLTSLIFVLHVKATGATEIPHAELLMFYVSVAHELIVESEDNIKEVEEK